MSKDILLFTFEWTDEYTNAYDHIKAWCRQHDVPYQYTGEQLELRLRDRWEPIQTDAQDGCIAVYTDWPLEYQYHDLITAVAPQIPFRADEIPLHDYDFSLKKLDSFAQLQEEMEYAWAVRTGFVVGNFAFINATPSNKNWIAAHRKDGSWRVFECLDLPEIVKGGVRRLLEIAAEAEEAEQDIPMQEGI